MYPANLFSLFPPFPREPKVFVAMSFDRRFDERWNNVISPAIRNIEVNGVRLEPFRVDARLVSDSILTEILSGISNSRLVFVDITTIGFIDDKAIRNGNVMYELGLSHSVRLAEEVIIFRSDNDQLLFDTSNIRINNYDPDENPAESKSKVENTLISALKEIDLRKHLAVSKAADVLDEPSYWLLAESMQGKLVHPTINTMRSSVANSSRVYSINKLLELGALKAAFLNVTPELLKEKGNEEIEPILKYEITEFGISIFNEIANRLGLHNPRLVELITNHFEKE